jgi:outer membrane protein assembly factor BamB
MGMALAAATFSGRLAMPQGVFAAVDDNDSGTWNWRGNAGHTGEMPGPGLNLDGPLGEIWRVPDGIFGGFVGYLNDVVYTANGDDPYYAPTIIAARNLLDGKLLWWLKAPNVAATPEASGTPAAEVDGVFFSSEIAIDNDLVLVTLSNGHLWALDALTGDLRWDFDSESDDIQRPTVVDHVAYFGVSGGVCAVELGDLPEIRWKTGFDGYVLGVDGGLVYVAVQAGDGQVEIRALAIEDGAEFWRTTGNELGDLSVSLGIVEGDLLGMFSHATTAQDHLAIVDGSGSFKWYKDAYNLDNNRTWFLEGVVATVAEDYDTYRVQGLFAENGQSFWELALHTDRWGYASDPVICASIAYTAVSDFYGDLRFVLVADPVNAKLIGALETNAIPIFVGDGIMLAKDRETDDIIAIGTVSSILQAGGRAKVTKDTTLRGAPSESAIERENVTSGTAVNVTGEPDTSNDTAWLPITVSDTDASGWLPADVLEGMDGDIKISPIDISEFGQFTTYPKFNSGTKARITEKVDMRGAPSESSAKKSTLETGTLVTVTSPPTTADDVEWCPIVVDDTGDNGWVPTSVIELAP